MRLIDADAIDTRYSDPEVVETLETAPTVDVVPVVRCRECKFLHLSSLEKWCWNEDSICYAGKVTDNWYCADGKKRRMRSDSVSAL